MVQNQAEKTIQWQMWTIAYIKKKSSEGRGKIPESEAIDH
jgi:hypothetical protein